MLTPKQERFVEEYLLDLNATQAAIRAGYAESGARTEGARLLANADIRARVREATNSQSQRVLIDADRVLTEIAYMAFYDPAALVEVMVEVGPGEFRSEAITTPAHIKFLPEGIRRAIVGWGYDRNQNFTLKLADKSKALDQLARHLSLYNDKLEVNVTDNLADRLARAKARVGRSAGHDER